MKNILKKLAQGLMGGRVNGLTGLTRTPAHPHTRIPVNTPTRTLALVFALLVTGCWGLVAPKAYALYYYGGSGDGANSRTMAVVVGTPALDGVIYVKLPVDNENLVKEDGQYRGMSVFMTSGTNINKCYLIVNSDERTVASDGTDIDTISINTDSAAGFSAGDSFTVVDRVYNKKSTNGNVDLSASGTTTSFVTWVPNGMVILDAESLRSYNVYAATGLTGVKWSDSFKQLNYSSALFGGEAYASHVGGYYKWGHETITAAAVTGDWSSTASWAGGVVPGEGKIVIIPSGANITVDQDVSAGDGTTTAAITVQAGGTLAFSTAASRTITAKGDIIVAGTSGSAGTLTMRAGASYTSKIQFDCASNGQYGLTVQNGGVLDVEGYSKNEQNCIITALTQVTPYNETNCRNGYIKCLSGSKTKLKFAELSYLGANSSDKYGISVPGIDSNSSSDNEYFYIEGCRVHHGYMGIFLNGSLNNIIYSNDIYFNFYPAIYAQSGSNNNIIAYNNCYSNSNYGIIIYLTASNNILIGNNCFSNSNRGIRVYDNTNNNLIYNNTSVANTNSGIGLSVSATGNILRNNICAYNTTYGIEDVDNTSEPTNSYNDLYLNGTSPSFQITSDPSNITAAPNFYGYGGSPSYSSGGASGASTIVLTTPTSWTANQFKNYVLWASKSGSNIFRGIDANTVTASGTSTVTIRGTWPSAMDGTYSYKVIDFSVRAIELLGGGCRLDTAAAQTETNIGSSLGYVKNITDNAEFSAPQFAHDDATLEQPVTAANTITTYAVDLKSDSIQGGITTTGAVYVKFNVSEDTITVNQQYIGQYLYMTTGANRGNYYLIVDSAEAATDTITICPNLFTGTITAGFAAYDSFTIVDRVYDRDSGLAKNANLYLTKDGTASYPITWNTSGTVIVDAKHLRYYGILGSGMTYNVIQGFMCEHGNTYGIYLSTSSNNTLISNNGYSNSSAGFCLNGSSNNTLISNNGYSNNVGFYFYGSSNNNTLISNNGYLNPSYGIRLESSSNNALISNNSYSNSYYSDSTGIYLSASSNNNTLISNNNYSSSGYGINSASSSNTLYNNTCIMNTNSGISFVTTSTSNTLRNNLSAYNTQYGIYADGTSTPTTNGYNDLGNNGTGTSTGITEGTGTITTAPNFYAYPNGSSSFAWSAIGGNGTTQITLATPTTSWTANQYAGYVLWAYKTADGSGNIFRRIEYNTASSGSPSTSTIGIYGTSPGLDNTYTYKVIDWTVQAPELLGAGCYVYNGTSITAGTGPADATPVTTNTNIGAWRGYVKNNEGTAAVSTDDIEYNFLQAANDAAACTAGDTITLYSVDYKSGTIGATVTPMGPYIEVQVADGIIAADRDYVGSYMYNSTSDKSVLIINSDATVDKVMLYTNSTTGWTSGTFIITDRAYNRKDYTSANLKLSKSGALNGQWITWADSGTILLDAESLRAYNVYADTGLTYLRLKDTIKLLNHTDAVSGLGGVAITNQADNYYKWGDADRPALNNAASSYTHESKVLSLNFSEVIDLSEVDATKVQLGNDASGTSNITLTAPEITGSQSDSLTITFTLTDTQTDTHRDAVAQWNAAGTTTLYVKLTTPDFKDLTGNAIDTTAWVALGTWTKDTTNPTLSSWSLNMNTPPQLTLVFNENVDASTLDVTKITLQNAASPTSSYTLTANSTSVSADGTTVVIDIFNSDFNAIVEKSPPLAASAGTSYLTMASGAIKDMSWNASNAVSAKLVTDGGGTYTANTVAPTKFKITTTAGATMEAGAAKVIIIKAYDSNDCLTPAYGGASGQDKTLRFSGANASPENAPPVKDYVPKAKNKSNTNIDFASDTVITFINATASTTLTLFCEETALIAASDTVSSPNVTTANGDRLSITVSQAPFAAGRHMAFSQQPSATGVINVALARQPIVAIRDVYGNQTDETYSITIYDTIEADFYTDGPGTISATVNPVTAVDGQANFAAVKYDNVNSGNPVYIYAYSAEAGTAFSSGITFSTSNTTTVDAAATPVADFNITPTNDSAAEKFAVLKFKVTDAGGDLNPTLIDRIQVAVGGTGANASTDIAWVGLYNGVTQIATATGSAITNSLITFGSAPDAGSDADLVSITDASSTEFTVYVYMKNSKLTAAEDQTYTFDTDESKIGVDTGASSQMVSDSGAITAVTGTIVVNVSYLEIVDQTTGNASITMNAGSTNELQMRATDANKNIDTGYTGLHSFLFTGLNTITKDAVTYRPKIETTIIGSGTYISINFASGVSAAGGVTLTAYKAETQNLSVAEQNQAYSVFALGVTVNSLGPTSITKQAGDAQIGAVSKQLSTALTVAVTDTYGNPAANQNVTFTISAPVNGAKLSNNLDTQVVATNASGQAATYLTLGTVGAVYTVTANYPSGTPVSFTETAVEPSLLTITNGNTQSQAVNTTLTEVLTVKLAGVGNVPIPGETINFAILSVPAGATGQQLTGGLTTYSVATDSNGLASTTLKLGNKTGGYVVRATYGALNADFTETATPAAAYKVVLSGPASATAGVVSSEFTVTVKDIYDNAVNAGTSSIFSLSSTSGTGNFYSDSEGTTSITNVTIGAAASSTTFYYKDTTTGSPTLTVARTSGVVLTVGSSNLNVTITPTGLSFFRVTDATTVLTAGATRTVTVTAYDTYGNVKTNLGATNIVFSGANSSPSPSNTPPTCTNSSGTAIVFGENTSLSFINGVAASIMKLYKPESVAIKATSGAITTTDANDLEFIVRHAAPDHLKFSANIPTPAGGFVVGTAFPLGTLHGVDLYSNLCDGANGGTAYSGSKSLTYSLSGTANSPDGASTDTYTTTVDFTAGASTTVLTTTLYRAQATTITGNATDLDGIDVASNSITLAPGAVNKLTFNTQPSTTVTTNIVFAQQPIVAVADRYGNPVLSANEQIILTASTTTGSYTAVSNGTLSADSLSVVVSNGLATFSGVKYSYPENIYLRASANSGGVSDIYSYQIGASTATDLSTAKITAGLSDTVSSIANSSAEKTNVYSFKVTDAGTDGYGAALKKITINRSASDTTSDWTDYISGAYLTDGTTQFTGTVEANKIYFGTGNTIIYAVSDGQNKTYTLSVYLKPSLPTGADNKVLGFTMDANTDITCDTASSRFAAVDAIEDTATVIITATGFRITGTAAMTTGGTNNLSITAIDANRNTDTDYSGYKALIFSGANDSPLGNHPSCTNYGGTAVSFGSVTDVEFASGVNSSTGTMRLYKAEIAYIKATEGTITTSSTNHLAVTVSAGSVARLSWYTQPVAKVVAKAPWKSFTISVTDTYGNTTSSTADITVTPTGGSVSAGATATVTATAGLAIFNNFAVTCSAYPGSVTLNGSGAGVSQDTGASNDVRVDEQYTININAKDSLTNTHLTEVTLAILESGAVKYGPTTGNSPFENIKLSYATYTINLTKPKYVDSATEKVAGVAADGVDGSYDNVITWDISMTSLEEATADYQVKSSFVYDEDSEDLAIRLWLERRGKLVINDAAGLNILGTAVIEIFDDASGAWFNTVTLTGPTNPLVEGVYKRVIDNVLTAGGLLGNTPFVAGKTYYAKCKINYGGATGDARTYEGGTTFTISITQKLSKEIIGKLGVGTGETLMGKISERVLTEGLTTREAVSTAQSTLTSAVTTAQSTLTTAVSTAQSTLTSAVTTAQTAISDVVKSEILNSENSIRGGQTLTVRFRSYPGLSPKVDVYDANNNLRVNKVSMTEIGTTGIYESNVKFSSGWGYGDYTVVCTEASKSVMDAFTLTVLRTDIEQVSGQVSAILGSTSGISGLKGVADTLNSQFSVIETALSKVGKDMIKDVKDAASSAPALEAVFAQLSKVAKEIKSLTGNSGINLDKLYKVSADKKEDMNYLKNKTQQLKAAMEVSQKMVDNIANKPVTQTWYEYR